MNFIKLKKIHEKNLTSLERLFSLSISCNSYLFKNEIKNLYEEVGDDKLWKFSTKEKSQSIVSRAFEKIYDRGNINKKWLEASNNISNQINLYMNELDKLSYKLSQNGIQILALKNTGIARGIYKDYASSPMGDIDLLVKPKDFYKAHKFLIELGYEFADRSPFEIRNIKQAFKNGGAEYKCKLINKKILWIELQWRSVAGRWIQPSQEPSAEILFKNSIPIENSTCRLLSPEDNLLQVCLHTAKHSYVRAPGFRLHTDVDRIVNFNTINWDEFCCKVEYLRVRTPVYLALLIPKVLLRSKIPKEVLQRLNFSPLKHLLIQNWLLKVGLFGPDEKKWTKLGYIFFNLILFDTFYDLFRAIFPRKRDLKLESENTFLLFFYFRRIFGLLFKRSKNT